MSERAYQCVVACRDIQCAEYSLVKCIERLEGLTPLTHSRLPEIKEAVKEAYQALEKIKKLI